MNADPVTESAAEIARIKCRQAVIRRIRTTPNPYRDDTVERLVWDTEIQRQVNKVRMQA